MGERRSRVNPPSPDASRRLRTRNPSDMVVQWDLLPLHPSRCVRRSVLLPRLAGEEGVSGACLPRLAAGRFRVRTYVYHSVSRESNFQARITVGYHRLYSHKAFKAAPGVRVALALLGSAGFQGSIKVGD